MGDKFRTSIRPLRPSCRIASLEWRADSESWFVAKDSRKCGDDLSWRCPRSMAQAERSRTPV